MTRRLLALVVTAALILFSPSSPDAALSTASAQVVYSTATPAGRISTLRIRCDNSGSISGTGQVGGETCATGTWWQAIDATGAKMASLSGREYGDGSAQIGLFNCQMPVGAGAGGIPGLNVPGIDSPTQAPTPAVPGPLCTRINVDLSGATVPWNGVATQEIHWIDRNFDFLVLYMDNCTGNCDLSAQLRVVW